MFHTKKHPTAALATFGFNDDTDTGITSTAANTISLLANGTDQVVCNGSTVILKPAGTTMLTASATSVLLAQKLGLYLSGGAASASGLLMGVGTTANPAATSTADAKFVEIRAKTTATSGDNRLMYLRYDIGGAAGSGECLRASSVLTAAANTAHGAHMSLITTSTTGYITGQGCGSRSTLQIANAAVPANGTYYGALVEVYSDGSSSSVAAAAKHAILGIAANGNATGAATVLNAISFDGISGSGLTTMITTKTLTPATLANSKGIRILVNGEVHWLIAVPSAEWD